MTGDSLSPCVGICGINPGTEHCRGCYRTLAEIAAWMTLDEDAKRRILAELPERGRVARGR